MVYVHFSFHTREVIPPWQPNVVGSLDTSQFDREFTSMSIFRYYATSLIWPQTAYYSFLTCGATTPVPLLIPSPNDAPWSNSSSKPHGFPSAFAGDRAGSQQDRNCFEV